MRQVQVRLLPDKSGRVRIHWFQRLDDGPVKTGGVAVPTLLGPLRLGGARGRIACNPQQKEITPTIMQGGVIQPCVHSDDPRAATCPECLATSAHKEAMAVLAETLET